MATDPKADPKNDPPREDDGPRGEEIDLDESDDEILDRIWDRINEEESNQPPAEGGADPAGA